MIKEHKISDFLIRIKNQILIEDGTLYKRVTVSGNHKGVKQRDEILGATIGTKKQFTIKGEDFILSKIDARNGAFGIIPQELDKAIITGNFWTYSVDTNIVDTEWFFYFTHSYNFIQICIESSTGSTHRKYLDEKTFLNHKIILPKIEDQKEMVKAFKSSSEISKKLIQEIDSQKHLLSLLKQAILQEAIQGKLTADWRKQNPNTEPAYELLKRIKAEKAQLIKDKKLKKGNTTKHPLNLIEDVLIPESWEWCKADEILFTTKLAGFEYSKHISFQSYGDIPVIRAQNVRPINITKNNLLYIDKETSFLLNRCALVKECLLVTFIGAGIGDVATFNEKTRWHLAPNVAKMEPFVGCEDILEIKYLNYFLLSPVGRNEIFKHIKATAQPSLSMTTIRDIDFPLPPISEQKEIVKKVEQLIAHCQNLEQEIKMSEANAQVLMQAVLKEAFEG